jgi:hypothetical protein
MTDENPYENGKVIVQVRTLSQHRWLLTCRFIPNIKFADVRPRTTSQEVIESRHGKRIRQKVVLCIAKSVAETESILRKSECTLRFLGKEMRIVDGVVQT